jgi:DNA polymerase type B, organellar and viral
MEFKLNKLLFTKDLFQSKLDLFWAKTYQEFTDNNHMFILFKVKYNGSDYTTIGNLQRLNVEDKDWYLNWIINNMIMKSEYYNETSIESFIFSYGFKNDKISRREKFNSNVNFQHYKNNKLVISYNPLDYGKLVSKIKIENFIQFILQTNENLIVKINQFDKYNEVSLISGGDILFTYKDEWISDSKFIRNLDNKKFYFENNKEILFIKEMKGTKFIPKLAPTKNLKNEFITFDIETYIQDSILIVYCISIYDGKSKTNFYLSDYKNVDELIITALKSIMIRKYNGYNVYLHNMAKFDIIFLFKYLVELGVVDATIHNQRIININFNFGKDNQYQIQFRDSYLLLLHSLSKLCKAFKVENPKTIFPIFFVNENNLDYIGKVPGLKYFKNIKINEYINYKSKFNNNWNLKEEAIKYCNLDCISLYQVIFKFNEMIFDLFQRNVHHYTTLPSLAFAIFRSKFMKDENIPQLSGKIAKDIRQGYTGGSCDVFIPQSKPGVRIKCYDVNSLYP